MFAKGSDGAPQDFAKAIRWITQAARQGQREALVFLESIPMAAVLEKNAVYHGLMRELHRCELASAAQGCVDTQFSVAIRCYRGQGVEQDFRAAFQWFLKAARQGHMGAQVNVGVMYQNGEGVTQDYREAVKWFADAARGGHARAVFQLGVMYLEGKGVTKDERAAAELFHKAAAQNQVDAQAQLATLYGLGMGVELDKAEAFKWMALAVKNAMPGTKEILALMKTEMSPREIADGQSRADEFRPVKANSPYYGGEIKTDTRASQQ